MRINNADVLGSPEDNNYKICLTFASKIYVDEFESSLAGNSCNNVIAATKLGLKCQIYTEFGNDGNAELFIKEFKAQGIDTTYCIQNEGTPTNVHAIISYRDERTILSYHEPQTYKVRNWPKPKWIYYTSMVENFDGFQASLVEYLKENPDIGIAFNPGTYHMKAGVDRLKNILHVSHVLFVNREEAHKLVGEDTIENVHQKLHDLGPKLTIVTEGSKGSSAYDGHTLVAVGKYTDLRPVVDNTGAGDAHSSGVLAALHYKKDMETALKWGTINAASVIRQVGATHGQVNKAELEELLKHNPSFEQDEIK